MSMILVHNDSIQLVVDADLLHIITLGDVVVFHPSIFSKEAIDHHKLGHFDIAHLPRFGSLLLVDIGLLTAFSS